jgi:flagella basal body P-ring formation protein FlgA
MTMSRAHVAITLLFTLTVVSHAEEITLKTEAYVGGPTITLGDIALIKGPDSELLKTIEIGPAASPGSFRRVDAALIQSKIQHAGFDAAEFELSGRRTTVKTLSLDVKKGMIAENLRRFIQKEMPWDSNLTLIDVTPPSKGFTVSDGEIDFVWKPNPQYNYLGHGSFRGELVVDGIVEKSFYAKANIETYQPVLVATTSIARGESLSDSNTRLEKKELSSLNADVFFSLTELEGSVARSSIFQGQVLNRKKVVPKTIVKRNQIIPVETRIGGIRISSRGLALKDGSAGEILTCRNLGSKTEFTGILQKNGVLLVQ